MTNKFYHCAPLKLGEGSVICRGNWGRIIRLYRPNAADWGVAYQEHVLEEVRAMHFPEKPSRLDAAFLLPDIHGAEAFRQRNGKFLDLIYEVELIEPDKPRHLGDWNSVRPKDDALLFDSMKQCATDYWQGKLSGCREIVVQSDIRILRQVS